jgi:rhodanese-related sulfurtransferase
MSAPTNYWMIALGKQAARLAILCLIATIWAGAPAFADVMAEASVSDAATQIQQKQVKVLDVREPSEHAGGVIQGALLMPLGQIEKRLTELAQYKDQAIYVVCGSGVRSTEAIKTLAKYGFTQLTNVKGGMDAWRKQRLPTVRP